MFGVDLRYAIGASIISVIATSSGSAAAYVRDGYSNVRIGLFLKIAASLGAITGAALAAFVPTQGLAILFGVVLLYSALASKEHEQSHPPPKTSAHSLGERFRLNGVYPSGPHWISYSVVRVPWVFSLCWLPAFCPACSASVRRRQSSCHGPGHAPAFQSLDHDQQLHDWGDGRGECRMYLKRGYVLPGLAMPVMLGVLIGSLIGARILMKTSVGRLHLSLGHSDSGGGDDLQRRDRSNLTWI